MTNTLTDSNQYQQLKQAISQLLQQGRQQAIHQMNNVLVHTYWQIGKHIVEFEQQGNERAEYGTQLLNQLAKDLKAEHGKGFSRRNVLDMRRFYLAYPKWQTVSAKLSWSHYTELLSISDELSRSFYEQQCIKEKWSVRELKRQRNSALFERLALSKDKQEILTLSKQGQILEQARDLVKDPYIFEFLDIAEQNYGESELEKSLIEKLEHFLLELGKGFAFIGQQYRMTLDNTHFYVDLVFYHRILKCFVLIDLKTGKVSHQDIGQMNLYLNYFKAEENMLDDNEPIGIVLAADKDEIMVEYATGSISNQLFVSRYQLYLPDVELLKQELQRLLEVEDE
jgi:predicted nuclease of restriction endonuclease-like (RecB) superfamily